MDIQDKILVQEFRNCCAWSYFTMFYHSSCTSWNSPMIAPGNCPGFIYEYMQSLSTVLYVNYHTRRLSDRLDKLMRIFIRMEDQLPSVKKFMETSKEKFSLPDSFKIFSSGMFQPKIGESLGTIVNLNVTKVTVLKRKDLEKLLVAKKIRLKTYIMNIMYSFLNCPAPGKCTHKYKNVKIHMSPRAYYGKRLSLHMPTLDDFSLLPVNTRILDTSSTCISVIPNTDTFTKAQLNTGVTPRKYWAPLSPLYDLSEEEQQFALAL